MFDLSNVSVSPVVKTNHLTVKFEVDELESRLCVRPGSNRVFRYSTCVFNCIIGNRDFRGGPVLVIDVSCPDLGNVAYTSVELARLFMYFLSIPT